MGYAVNTKWLDLGGHQAGQFSWPILLAGTLVTDRSCPPRPPSRTRISIGKIYLDVCAGLHTVVYSIPWIKKSRARDLSVCRGRPPKEARSALYSPPLRKQRPRPFSTSKTQAGLGLSSQCLDYCNPQEEQKKISRVEEPGGWTWSAKLSCSPHPTRKRK